MREMADKNHFDLHELHKIFSQVKLQPDVLKAISAPATALPWSEYRALFINSARVAAGVKFWEDNAKALTEAREKYGVPEEIIVATIGVETRYGRNTGSYRVLDTLTTLAFDFPPRAEFFKGELEQYLLFTRDYHIDPLSLKGSYAGAMGMPQFIPSAYRRYAVDFDGDGKLNLWGSPADAIGSIANYYQSYGWKTDELIVVGATVSGDKYRDLLAQDIEPHMQVGELQKIGVTPKQEIPAENLASLFALGEGDETQYWLALNNFYVITRYNRSVNYAMVVYELSSEIRAARGDQPPANN